MKRFADWIIIPLIAAAGPVLAEIQPPAYTPVRWNEDYSYLRDPEQRTDPFDPVKYIPLNEEGDWYLSLGGQARYRYENWRRPLFGAAPSDDWHLLRLHLHADLHLGRNLRTFVQLQSAWEEGRDLGPRPMLDQDRFNVHQAFVDVKVPFGDVEPTLRLGRQNLIYGAQRLISPLEWANVRRTFDGAKVSLAWPENVLDLFWVRPVRIEDDRAFNRTDHDVDFAGGYYVRSLPGVFEGAGSSLDVYTLHLDRETAVFEAGAANERRYTVGGRFSTRPRPWDADVEAAFQFGDFGPDSIRAWMFAAEGGYTVDTTFSPRLLLGFDIASGDRRPDDGRLGTFNQLFPLGHAYHGYIDVIGRQNIIDLHPGFVLNFSRNVNLRTAWHWFWRHSRNDALYNAGGAIVRPGVAANERYIGSELDLLLNWRIDRHWQAHLGYSRFFSGAFIRETGPARDIDFIYATVQFTF